MSDFSDATDTAYRELKAAHVEAARLKPATDTREAIDAELRRESDRALASRVEHDCPETAIPWASMNSDEKRGWRARNEISRRRFQAERQAVAAATSASATAQHTAASDATRAALRQQLTTPGLSGQALENAIDAVLTTKAIAGVDAIIAEKRARYGSF